VHPIFNGILAFKIMQAMISVAECKCSLVVLVV
jgi:hypothetical protein